MLGKILCALGFHRWGKAQHRMITMDGRGRYEQRCGRPGCIVARVAPRRLWGPLPPKGTGSVKLSGVNIGGGPGVHPSDK